MELKLGDKGFHVVSVKVTVPEIIHNVGMRLDTSDIPTFYQIFVNKEYAFPCVLEDFKPNFVIDCGGNVGYSSVWFANIFPDATIIAIEPDDENYLMMLENAAPYPKISCKKAAIWYKNGTGKLITHNANGEWLGYWGLQITEDQNGLEESETVDFISIDDLLSSSGHDYIDILKVDVEGAEKEIFSHNYTNWLSKTNVVIIETHDRFKPGCSYAVRSAISNKEFDLFKNGENLFFVRKKFIQ